VLTRNRSSFEFPILTINFSEAEHKHDTKLIIVGCRSIIGEKKGGKEKKTRITGAFSKEW